MGPEFQLFNPLEFFGWDDLLPSGLDCAFFCTVEWTKALWETYGYIPLYIGLLCQGTLRALLPCMEIKSVLTGCRGVSLPFSDFCDPIIGDSVDVDQLLADILALGRHRKWRYLELRGDALVPSLAVPFRVFLHHRLFLSAGEAGIFGSFSGATRRNILRAKKEGVQVTVSTSHDAVEEFYQLNCLTRKRLGVPPQPHSLFEGVCKHVLANNLGIVALASHEDKVIAGAMYFHFGKRAIFKYGASDRMYNHFRANNLVMWEAIQWYIGRGFESLSFGRTEPWNQGLARFKRGWGASEEVIPYFRFDMRNGEATQVFKKRDERYRKILQRTPIPILKLIGTCLYRHMG